MRTTTTLAIAGMLAATSWMPALAADKTGEEIVKSKCAECHAKGLHGSPKIGDRTAWNPRLKNGLDAVVLAAIRGHGDMPARGGLAGLTDAEFKSAIVYMVNPAGPLPKPAEAPAPGPNHKIVDGTEVYLGMKPVTDGVYHVNITLRDSKTHAVIDNAQVQVSVTNPVMGGESRKLSRMTIDRVVSYGEDFRISSTEPHKITVQIRRPDRPGVIETKFDFRS